MGLAVDTNDTFKYVFQDERALPENEQPYLIFRYLSARDSSKMERLFEASMQATQIDAIIASAIEGIAIGLVGWCGFKVPFNIADIDAVLSRPDIMELVRELNSAMTVTQGEKKRSVSLSLSTSAKSANEMPTASALANVQPA